MKKRRWGLWISLFVVCFIAIYIYLSSFTLLILPQGDFIVTSTSPDNTYTLNAYLIDTGGALGAFAIRGELLNNLKGTRKNIYWDYRVEKANMRWLDDTHLVINGKTLNVEKETYDFRKYRKQPPK
ncbi:DUF5412 domain-containing protein [Paenibacillus thiaminolyticus]|uniref:DUF5412 domain-containing protein n=1 Tax=Paenibacillus thiaminolyticus TaxID=49283 RepID=A0AAP9DZF1_PANTH|nr:DUF5412 domain-containing protein [Paenibacillus thiaminolyticus]MCY9537205.1 DUF5412 domain-containing protein [Paenibacillus thiaminolyticus]MCY9605545.1 DUF5412 domain-containing protein [Paenibacillus thiaminolyticus]MCY9611111.1 DUF5412 domain-containing protein [Paenibacillus thiaminolyticus]MCY9616785.1 DUF5412 domain-containing protein [Paenibacillus thiaminolyticus]MCY9622335.1 DUF5412 domain-containing protein [Paenibacillus thiaminolyticus]